MKWKVDSESVNEILEYDDDIGYMWRLFEVTLSNYFCSDLFSYLSLHLCCVSAPHSSFGSLIVFGSITTLEYF